MIYFFDTETSSFSNKPEDFRIGVLRSMDDRIFTIDSTRCGSGEVAHNIMKCKLLGLKKYSVIYCHSYDVGVMFGDYIHYFSKPENGIILGDKLYQCTYQEGKGNKNIKFKNILNLFPNMPLVKVGEILELPKLTTPEKFKRGCSWDEIIQEDIDYCLRDTEIPKRYFESLFKLIKEYNVHMRLTVPSLSMKTFDKNFNEMKYNKKTRNSFGKYYHYFGDKDYHHRYYKNEIALKTYRGGISQNIIRGFYNGPIYKYDVNSLYSTPMEKEEFGTGAVIRIEPTKDNLFNFEYGFGRFNIDIPYKKIPNIPYKKDDKSKFLFPYGKINRIWMNLPELKHNLDIGVKLRSIDKLYVCKKTAPIFRDFVQEFYKKRFEGSKINKFLYKLILNGLYGRYALRIKDIEYITIGDVFELLDLVRHCKDKKLEYEFIEDRADYVRVKHGKFIGNNSIVHISSNVTSYSRMVMYKLINKYEDSILYMDTDSLFTTKKLPAFEIHQTKLGKLKFEGKFYCGYILNPKHYLLFSDTENTIVKIKGIRDKSQLEYPTQTKFIDEYVTSLKHSYHLKDYDYLDQREVTKEYTFDNSKRIFDDEINIDYDYCWSEPIKVNIP